MARGLVYDIDMEELEKLCAIHCTIDEIAAWFRMSKSAIEKRQQDNRLYEVTLTRADGTKLPTEQITFRDLMARGYARGRVSIRRQQIKLLESGGAGAGTMAVWLGKQILGQRDSFDLTVEDVTAPNESHAESIRRRVLGLVARTDTDAETQRPN